MGRNVAIGIQKYDKIIENNYFYIDKTAFIKEWWESGDEVTLITRPRRFGKTLTMSMIEQFFSQKYAGRGDLFECFSVWEDERYHSLQGAYPVISLSFANIKENTFAEVRNKICQMLADLYQEHSFLLDSGVLGKTDKEYFERVSYQMGDADASMALHNLSKYLYKYYGKKAIILLDEYDAPMQEAYVDGFWENLTGFTRNLFNSTFKTNPWLERAIMTGITRVSKESIFSDLNNLEVVTTTSNKYEDSFGFTEEEVFTAMDEFGYTNKEDVKYWYDGFVFGDKKDIYNPWSILNYLDKGRLTTYWANTSSNSLIGKLIREGSKNIKTSFSELMKGNTIKTVIDEQIVYNQLDLSEKAIWSLLLASGYMKVIAYENQEEIGERAPEYELALTNREVKLMFGNMISGWFEQAESEYNDFIKALLLDDVDAMNEYMNSVALMTFSSFDTGRNPSKKEDPERFYHGFVLGLMVDLQKRYRITSNRESGFGRYDIMLEPFEETDNAIIIEFKVFNKRREKSLDDTLQNALKQIEDKMYEKELLARGISVKRIRKYGFAFEGKTVLIGS